jgi:hydrogenase maturation protein HypF
MLQFESIYLDGVLYHQREILTPLDDSVVRVFCGFAQSIRRSRGYVPSPIPLQIHSKSSILAMGGDLKSCFCLLKDGRAYLSQYFGDMEDYEVSKVYRSNLSRMKDIFRIEPSVIACDLHLNYFTSHLAAQWNKPTIPIQHHHAHIASVMAEHGLSSCIGVAFDGTGYGTDGCVWGGEFLLCEGAKFERSAHLGYVTLCGGDKAAKDAELTALCYLQAAEIETKNSQSALVKAALVNHINTFQSASMGRLFDAVSAILNIRNDNTYEGECAIALENAACSAQSDGLIPFPLNFELCETDSELVINQVKLIKDIYDASKNGVSSGSLALGFHLAVAQVVLTVCHRIRVQSGENRTALSGGVFANLLLTQECAQLLQADGFEVLLNSEVPCNDSGICLGQAWLCAQNVE